MKLSVLILVILGMALSAGCAPSNVAGAEPSGVQESRVTRLGASEPVDQVVQVSQSEQPSSVEQSPITAAEEVVPEVVSGKCPNKDTTPVTHFSLDKEATVIGEYSIRTLSDIAELGESLPQSKKFALIVLVDDESQLKGCSELMNAYDRNWPTVQTIYMMAREQKPIEDGTLIHDVMGKNWLIISSEFVTR
ncbi:hypothetical protein A3A70_02760 [candidate division WWE3 bacterium RIFCSPLOWO2_01_FULL_42_11]|uniref:Uncharacterized protein n=1 Tax=candidate division WWE3 bacterium RIFCSPLOWO2_01_FULL_42_11 TaxID=1802627 RepID=A0A1F4VM70_UNCKA|nr:MAG: hypothetical protein A3A70_02760 [candidate division WWE3 bacterium RIFCSPLOWO2_01_FULL_42_11]